MQGASTAVVVLGLCNDGVARGEYLGFGNVKSRFEYRKTVGYKSVCAFAVNKYGRAARGGAVLEHKHVVVSSRGVLDDLYLVALDDGTAGAVFNVSDTEYYVAVGAVTLESCEIFEGLALLFGSIATACGRVGS